MVGHRFEDFLKRRSRHLEIVFFAFVAVALIVVRILDSLTSSGVEQNWDAVQTDLCEKAIATASEEFTSQQRLVRRTATDFGVHPAVEAYLAGKTSDASGIFAQAAKVSEEQGVGIEVFDRDGRLVSWDGRSGPSQQREIRVALDGQMTSNVSRSPVFSQLFVANPVRGEGSIIGVVLVRRTIEVDYPLNNAYISREGLAEELSRRLSLDVRFDFSPNAESQKDGRFASAVLYGIDSVRVGVVNVLRPSRAAFLENHGTRYQTMYAFLFGLLILGGAASAGRRVMSMNHRVLRSLSAIALIWLARFGLLWLDFPSVLLTTGIFDPALFASGFGWGLAKSVGEMTISTFALVLTTIVAVRAVWSEGGLRVLDRLRARRILSAFVFVAGLLLLYWILRGYAAAVRSAVFDSTINFTDTRVLIPPIDHGVMLLNLFALSWCLIAIASAAALMAARIFGGPGQELAQRRHWIRTAMLFLAGAVIFMLMPGEPLVSSAYRILFGAGAVAFAFFVFRSGGDLPSPLRGRVTLTAFALSAFLLYPLFVSFMDEKDHMRVEGFAQEVLRPVDSWFRYVIDEALAGFSTVATAEILQRHDPSDLDRLAFSHWASSSVCREGYASVFSISDVSGAEVSRFSIGGESVHAGMFDTLAEPPREKAVRIRTIGTGINAVRVYTGTVPIVSDSGANLGFARVVVAAGQQTLFRGDSPTILRGASRESLESYYRPVALSEFLDGILFTTTSEQLPIGTTLPDQVRTRLEAHAGNSIWVTEGIDGASYESFYVSRDGGPADVIALSLEEHGLTWHFINIVKMVSLFAVISLLVLVVFLILRAWRGQRLMTNFRDRLLVALLVIALIPLAAIATYGRYSASRRLMEQTGRGLDDETSTLVGYLVEQISVNSGGIRTTLSPALADQIASDLGIDFSLFIGNNLRMTSRPELFEAGLLDRRLSGRAFSSILVRGRRFYWENESIGLYHYAVGYRALQDASGAILGVVSVPTLYQPDQIEEETARRNAFLFGAYAFVLLIVIITATALANRIAAPIHALTQATRRVSRGEFDLRVEAANADGEVGELIRSFETMTRDLKRSREELVRIERELAWKEMAKQVAHEIKNPLTPMKLAIQHLRQTYRDRVPDFDQILDEVTVTIVGQIDTLSRIASEFSHFARMPERKLEPCDINAILRESAALFEQNTLVGIQLDLEEGLPRVHADREELRRAFINILRNGIQAMGEKGRMDVDSARLSTGIRVRFRDHGPGIPEEIRARLFEPNFSTKTEGMGLGLSIVKKSVDDLGGSITIESAGGGGTTVSIILPVQASTGGTS